MNNVNQWRRLFWPSVLVLLVISALTYLPLVRGLGYANDDWYLMYGAHVQGPDHFGPVFERDRPLRAFVLGPAYSLFGDSTLPYHLSAYVFRLLGAVSLLWMLYMLWPGNSIPNLLISLLFLIYPGFLSQVNPIDYQSQIVSLFAAMTSLALTVKALKSTRWVEQAAWTVVSVLLAWIYLGLVEYFLGLEVLRVLCVYLVALQRGNMPLRQRLWQTFRAWLPFSVGPIAFLIWRLFLFESERGATDVGLQFGQLLAAPVQTGLWWLAYTIQDTVSVILLAWGVPFYSLAFNLRLRDTWIGFVLAGVVAAGLIVYLTRAGSRSRENAPEGRDWRAETLWIGFLGAVSGLIPIILVNRHVELLSYSRYTLASSAGAAMVLVALFYYLNGERLRLALVGLLVASAVMTHYANAVHSAEQFEAVRNFWWQVSWRVPQLRPGTTLAVYHPAPIAEDYFVWGAANLIYYPEPQTAQPVDAPVSAAILTSENILQIASGKGQSEPNRRNTHVLIDYRNVLVMTQPNTGSCVRVLSGDQPELSVQDDHRIMLIAARSKAENILLDGHHTLPSQAIFGPEPGHDWCYYYQKADLARQSGDWATILRLQEEASEKGYYPNDSVEWMPFIQADVIVGDLGHVRKFAPIMKANDFLAAQTCQLMSDFVKDEPVTPEVAAEVINLFCP